MSTIDDLMRLVQIAGGANATDSDAMLRGGVPAIGPMPLPPRPALPAAPVTPAYPAPELGNALMGEPDAYERFASRVPENGITALLDLAGSLLRGHSAYADASKRASLNTLADQLTEQHTERRQ